jgi:NADH dehydrogenase FAD-containing subunit
LNYITLKIPAYGPKPNTEFIAQSLGANVLSSNKYIKVQPTLQLIDYPNIFVIGDAVDNTEQKQAAKAAAHAAIVGGNVIALLEGKALNPYKGSSEMIAITLGKVITSRATYVGLACTDLLRCVTDRKEVKDIWESFGGSFLETG